MIEFTRQLRECGFNESLIAAGKTRGLIYDFEVKIDGEVRGYFRRITAGGRGYELVDINRDPVRCGSSGISRGYPVECGSQASFAETIETYLNLIPTVEQAFWNAIRDGELTVIDHMADQARREQYRFGRHGWELLQASKQMYDAMQLLWSTSHFYGPHRNRAIAAAEVAELRIEAAIAKAEAES